MSDFYTPTKPQVVPVRPLNVGMVTNVPSVAANEKSFRVASGFDATARGMRRHGGWITAMRSGAAGLPVPMLFADSGAVAARRLGERAEDMFHMWCSDGSNRAVVVTNRMLYRMDFPGGFTPVPWCRTYTVSSYNGSGSDGVITLGSAYVTSDYLSADDWIRYSDGGTVGYWRIKSVSGGNQVTLDGKPASDMTGQTFLVYKPFKAFGSTYVDFTYGRYKTYLVDTFSPLVFQFDGTWLSPLVVTNAGGTRNLHGARSVAYYKERLYFGNVAEGSGETGNGARQRVRWTEVLDWTKSADENYQELSFRQGPLQKLLGYGDMLVAYMTDAVYYGRQTNLTGLPYAFYLLETAGVAPLGMKSVCSFIDGQLFAGPDDIYYLASGPQLTRIGSAIATTALTGLAHPAATRLRPDVRNHRVVLGVARTSESLGELYHWNFDSKGWSMSETPSFAAISAVSVTDQDLVSDVPGGVTFATAGWTEKPLASFKSEEGPMGLYGVTPDGYVMQYDPTASAQHVPSGSAIELLPVYGRLETQDFEFDLPGDDKSVLRFSMRLGDLVPPRSMETRFVLAASTDSGVTWRHLGVLRFRPEDDEDALDFRVTGSAVRFRLTTGVSYGGATQLVEPYEVVGYDLTVRRRGTEAQRGTTRSG